MKWEEPHWRDTRLIKRFLLFPRVVGGEGRWLEFVTIKQMYCGRACLGETRSI